MKWWIIWGMWLVNMPLSWWIWHCGLVPNGLSLVLIPAVPILFMIARRKTCRKKK